MITTVTLNASIDKAYEMAKPICYGEVMRVQKCRNSAGGKGINVARIVQMCKEDVQATGFVGGFNGKYLESLLEADGIKHNFEHIKGETRSCINILDPQYGSTEYLEPGCQVDQDEEISFFDKFRGIVEKSDVITLSGSAPKGLSQDIYKRLVEIVKQAGKQVILDTSGDYLKEGLLAKPTVVKPNKDELESLFNVKISSMQDVIQYAKKIAAMGIEYVIVSVGGDGAILVNGEHVLQGCPPAIKPVNTVGCGDSMVGAFAVALKRGYPVEKALAFAVGVATSNALTKETGSFEEETFEKIYKEVTVKEL